MAYIGNDLRSNEDYKIIDDISSGFNGSATSFALQVGGATPVPFPKFEQQLLISVNGVIQEPDPTGSAGFKLTGTNIVFSSAPTNGHSFFGVIYAGADYVNAGGTFPDGSINFPSITFGADTDSGFTRVGSGTIALISNGTKIAQFPTSQGSSGQALITDGSGNLSFGVPTAAFTDITLADSIIHSGDTNTKIRFPAADTVSVETGGSERLRVDSTGKVGIGTTSPSNKLVVNSAAHDDGLYVLSANNNQSTRIRIQGKSSGGTEHNWNLDVARSANRFGISNDGSTHLAINSSGNVGIGTTSPDTLLHIQRSSTTGYNTSSTTNDSTFLVLNSGAAGHATIQLQCLSGGTANTGQATISAFPETVSSKSTSLSFGTRDNSGNAPAERMRIDSAGRVLIGLLANAANASIDDLQVGNPNSSNQSGITIGSNDEAAIAFANNGDARAGSITYNMGADAFIFKTDGQNTRMRIENDGDVLIGTSSGVQNGRLEVRSDKTSASTVTFANTNASYVGTVMLLHAERETVNNSYEFIGCRIESPAPGVQAFRLEVGDDGDVRNVNGSYGTISDISLKENIVDANSQWDDFKNLKFRSYNYKESTGFPTHKQIGVVAQEAETVCPNLVQTGREDENTKETHKFVKTSILYMKGMKALQEAITKIEVLEAKVAALEAA